jgi:hypothetical protein
MENNKKIIFTIACSVLIIIMIIVLSIIEGHSKEETNNNNQQGSTETAPNDPENKTEIDVDPIIVDLNPTLHTYNVTFTITINNLDTIIKNAQFISNNTEDSIEDNISAKITDNNIIIDSGDIVYILDSIESAKAIKVSYLSDADIYPIQAYILTDNNELYNLLIYEDESSTINKYNINNIISFTMNADYLDNTEWSRNFIIIKTTDNKYYTDYQFSETREYDTMDTIELTEIK